MKSFIKLFVLISLIGSLIVLASCDKKKPIDDPKETPTYTLSFISNGGSVVFPLSCKEYEPIHKPNDPSKEGFNFAGWFYEYDFKTPVV